MRLVAAIALLSLAACRPPGWGEGDDAPATDAAPGGDAPAAIDAAPETCDQMFRLAEHASATSVWLTGDFVAWAGDPGAGALELALGAELAWTLSRTFDPGSYQYKFIVDGTSWIADPANPNFIDDGFGGRNSVYVCTP